MFLESAHRGQRGQEVTPGVTPRLGAEADNIRIRPDVKLLANYMLSVIPELRDSFFFVDPFDGPNAVRRNVASMREATEWVAAGGALGIFPTGEVSHLHRRAIADPAWSRTVGKIVKRTGASVVPAFFVVAIVRYFK
jgi:putative hemolysin